MAADGNGRSDETAREFSTLDEIVRHETERLQIPGMTVGTLINGDLRTHGYGVISLETHYPTRPDTLFQIGSNTKVFTATLAMQLQEEGRLDLDTPVKEYVPDLRLADERAQETITMRHLLTHLSGMEGDKFEDTGIGDDALQKYIDHAYTWVQETDPGEIWSYCNSGFSLAGHVIATITDKPYEVVMKERVFDPLGLKRTFWHAHEAIMYSAAAGHSQRPGQERPVVAHPWAIPRSSNPAGGIISNVEDVLTFMKFHMTGGIGVEGLIGADSIQAMQQVQARVNSVTEWGIGWTLTEIDDVRILSHGGSTNGHNTQMLAVPEKGFAISVLVNSDRGSSAYEIIIDWALERYCGLKRRHPEPITLSASDLERYAGRYPRTGGLATVSVADGGLQVDSTITHPLTHEEITMPPVRMVPIGDDEFLVTEGDYKGMRIDFIMGENGRPRFMRFGYRLVKREA